MVDLRSIFTRYRIEWRDRGSNVSRGNIVINCPWCGRSDTGQHLSIAEDSGFFYCFRDPRHKGKNVGHLFAKLGIPVALAGQKFEAGQKQEVAQKDFAEFQYFLPAESSQEAVAYLRSRLFENPVDAARQFNLRVAANGKWAGRLIIPLTVGWTGRSMRPELEPRYKAWTDETGMLLIHGGPSVCLLEGALDAYRLASVTAQHTIIAAQGQRVTSPTILLYLKERQVTSILYIPDADVHPSKYLADMQELRTACPQARVHRLVVPFGYKDLCQMQETQVREWFWGQEVIS